MTQRQLSSSLNYFVLKTIHVWVCTTTTVLSYVKKTKPLSKDQGLLLKCEPSVRGEGIDTHTDRIIYELPRPWFILPVHVPVYLNSPLVSSLELAHPTFNLDVLTDPMMLWSSAQPLLCDLAGECDLGRRTLARLPPPLSTILGALDACLRGISQVSQLELLDQLITSIFAGGLCKQSHLWPPDPEWTDPCQ